MSKEEAREATPLERTHMKHHSDVSAEISAMRQAFDALHKLTDDGKRRAMRWLDAALWHHGNEEPPF
jgi:hypothetical protein